MRLPNGRPYFNSYYKKMPFCRAHRRISEPCQPPRQRGRLHRKSLFIVADQPTNNRLFFMLRTGLEEPLSSCIDRGRRVWHKRGRMAEILLGAMMTTMDRKEEDEEEESKWFFSFVRRVCQSGKKRSNPPLERWKNLVSSDYSN